MSYNGGIKGTTAVLLDALRLTGPIVTPKFKSTKVTTRSTHDIMWSTSTNNVSIYASSDISKPEVFTSEHLEKYVKNNLNIIAISEFKSLETALFVKDKITDAPPSQSTTLAGGQAKVFQVALTNSGVSINDNEVTENSNAFDTSLNYMNVYVILPLWALYPGNTALTSCQLKQ